LKVRRKCDLRNYSYEHLEKAVSEIKREIPGIIICGAVPAQIIQKRIIFNPLIGKAIRYPETWKFALDPKKWKINFSKEELQCRFAKTHNWIPESLDCEDYSPQIASAYFPDLTNPEFQKVFLAWIKRQIDIGVDAIWIDMLFKQAIMLYKLTNDFNHPAVKESYEAIYKIIDEIHEYGKRKGKYLLVGSWSTAIYFPYPPPKLDFVTLTPSSKEVREIKLNEKRWDERLKLIRQKFGSIPIFAFIDWADSVNTPLGQFSQVLSKEEQRKFLEIIDDFFTKKGVIFVYPIHGGWMGNKATILSFGKSKMYDSLAPEFQTYETIKKLVLGKKGKTEKFHLDVINLGETDLKDLLKEEIWTKLLMMSLQGIVNKGNPKLYLIWPSKKLKPTPSERWLEYYKKKGWVDYRYISAEYALQKYKESTNGLVVFDPNLPDTLNLAVSLAGIENVLLTHPDLIKTLTNYGYKIRYDLRGNFNNKKEVYDYLLKNIFPNCNGNLIFLFPTENQISITGRMSLMDYAIANRACSISLKVSSPRERNIMKAFFKRMNKFAILLGYPYPHKLERPTVEFSSMYGLISVLGSFMAFNFSVHSKIGEINKLKQDHIEETSFDPNKIYITFLVTDLALNSMQSFYYEVWEDKNRGKIKLNWWMNPFVLDFSPGIAQYYYETKTPNDYFVSAGPKERIYAPYFPYLKEYFDRVREPLRKSNLEIVGINTQGKRWSEEDFRKFTEGLPEVKGFLAGFGPGAGDVMENYWIVNGKPFISSQVGPVTGYEDTYLEIKKYIDSHLKRPLFVPVIILIADWIVMDDLVKVKERLDKEYPGQIEWVRGDELMLMVMEWKK
jgi:hypothetical protein